MLEMIKGTLLSFFPLGDLELIADLIYFDGPILSLLKNNKDDYYFYCWSDGDDQFNRWLVFRITSPDLHLYLEEKEITLRQLILHPVDGFLYSADIDNDLNYHNVMFVEPANLPDSYLPTENTYYKFEPIYYDTHVAQVEGKEINSATLHQLEQLQES
jgi:hypothetical protein